MIGDRTQERRATRGLAAAARLQGQYKIAIQHLERVLEISQEMKEYTGRLHLLQNGLLANISLADIPQEPSGGSLRGETLKG